MDDIKLHKANEMQSKIKNLDKLIDHFIDNDGKLRHKPDQSVEVLKKFFNNCQNLTGSTDMKKLANNVIDWILNDFTIEVNDLRKQFKEL